ncbi:MAG: DHH family phosphoesterase, partial [Candidatus Saccharimonadales bacterium]
MDEQKKQVTDKLKGAKNVLVTVSANPSVDQLAACLGLTLSLNKLGKHAAAVFSGEVPSTIEFLKPEDTLEQNTDSLRDFIIALDKSKADKLRYKVEDKVVRIFITPYKTSITQNDLEFSEGDFNVDVVVALGVKDQQDIDQAVTAHGNILHDATVITMTTSDESGLGAIHWRDPAASGVSEMAASLAADFEKEVLDEQIATAFLTGIVARTERFSNNLTSSQTMTVAAKLMSAGANQQLVATKLEAPAPTPEPPEESEPVELPEVVDEEPSPPEPEAKPEDGLGMLEIEHDGSEEVKDDEEPPASPPTEVGP